MAARIVTDGSGIFRIQKFVTPQYRLVKPYSYPTPNQFNAPKPDASNPNGSKGRLAYKQQADAVLSVSANLTDHQKMMAEALNNKIFALGFSAVFAARTSHGLGVIDFVHLDFVTNLAAFDVGIVIWDQKAKWDAVRPFSAIRHIYGDRPVTAWGGPGKGTVNDLPASQWKEYLNVADHPEYPSASTAFCEAHAQAARRYFGSDALNWTVPAPKGSSIVEPGITPASDIVLGPWATWSDFATDCGTSRLWGGVHFPAAIAAARPIGTAIGELAYQFVKRHIDGNVPPLH